MTNDQNRDHFGDALDRMVSGQPQDNDDALASFAREIQMHQGAARLDPDRRAGIRRNLMQNTTATATTPRTGGAGPLSQPTISDLAAHNPWVRRKPANSQTPAGWRGHIVKAQTAIAIVIAFAVLIVGMAWYTSQEGGDGPDSSSNHFAAAPTESMYMSQGADTGDPLWMNETGQVPPAATAAAGTANLVVPPTAEGTVDVAGTGDLIVPPSDLPGTPIPVDNVDWTAPIDTDECEPRERRTNAERDEIMTGSPEFPERIYSPFTIPSAGDATDVATTSRQFEACRMSGVNADGYVSDRFVYERVNPAAQESTNPDDAARARAVEEVSAAYDDLDQSEFVIVIDGPEATPATSMTIMESPGVFQPHHARQLADGRIVIPASIIVQEGMFPEGRSMHVGNTYILSESDGIWAVDEMLPFCVGECDPFWLEMGPSADRPMPAATPDPSPAQTATPAAVQEDDRIAMIPVDDSIWLACPDYTGPYTLAARSDETGDSGSGDIQAPYTPWPGPAVPPTIPCEYPNPEPPPGFEPVPLD